MRLPEFRHHAPISLEGAFELLATHAGSCKILAGGTDVFPALKTGRLDVSHVIDVKGIPELNGISFDPKQGFRIGATASLTDVEFHAATIEHYPALEAAIWELATKQVRNKATVVGNLCNASPAADTATPLMAYGALAEICGPGGAREVPVEQLMPGPGRTPLEAPEIVSAVRLPVPTSGSRSVYLKFSPRSKVDIAAVNLAAALDFDGDERVARANTYVATRNIVTRRW